MPDVVSSLDAMSPLKTMTRGYVVAQASDGTIINCHIYDIAGQERYKALGLLYYQRYCRPLLRRLPD